MGFLEVVGGLKGAVMDFLKDAVIIFLEVALS